MATTTDSPGELIDGMWRKTWLPVGAARAQIVLLHGYAEHSGRYDHVGRALAQSGFAVYSGDLVGHGRSPGRRGYVTRFDDYFADVDRLVAAATTGGQSGKLFLVGHSMGGLVATSWLLGSTARAAGEAAVKGLVLSSPFFGLKMQVPALKRAMGVLASKIFPTLSLPAGLAGHDLTRDPELAAEHDRDPLNNSVATARWFTESSGAQANVLRRAGAITLPVLCVAGAADKVADPEAAAAVFAALGSKDKTLDLKPGQYHELLNEPPADREATLAEIVRWLELHLAAT